MFFDHSQPPSAKDLRRAVDPKTLLTGEDPASPYLEDAVHWVRVYDELLALKAALLARADQMLEGVTDDAMAEASIDQGLLRLEAERFRKRLAFWTQRARELTAEPRVSTSREAGGNHGAKGERAHRTRRERDVS